MVTAVRGPMHRGYTTMEKPQDENVVKLELEFHKITPTFRHIVLELKQSGEEQKSINF